MSSITRTSQRSSGGTDVVATIGPLTLMFDLSPVGKVNKSKETNFPYACPGDHDVVERVEQRYVCPDHTFTYDDAIEAVTNAASIDEALDALRALEGHHTDQDDLPGFQVAELARARDGADGVAVIATKDEITAAKVGGLEAGEIDFRVHQAWQLDLDTLPGKTAYRVRPSLTKKRVVPKKAMEVYASLVELVRTSPDLAIIGTMRVRDARSTYRLGVWGNQLILTEVLLPSDLAERDQIDVDVPESAVKGLRALLASQVEEFDETLHRFDAAAAVEQLVEYKRAVAAGEIEPVEPAEKPKVTDDDDGEVIDLTAMFAAMTADAA